MKTAVIYARYSSDNQTEQSIEGQLRVCQDYAEKNNILILKTYIDRAMTGTNDNRPDFQRMMKDCKEKQWDYVIVYKLDRFSRDKYAMAIHKKTLRDNNVKLVSAMENIPDSPEGIILESVLEGLNQYYSMELAQKVKRGMHETRLKGNFAGGYLLFGYRIENKKVLIDEEKAEIVKLIYEQYASGVFVKDIIKKLNEMGVTHLGKPFQRTTVYNILKNEKYSGSYTYNGERYDNTYPRIVSDRTFKLVRQKMQSNRYGKRSENVVYLLKGKVKCGYCGKSMISETGTSRNGDRKYYYKCYNRKSEQNCKKENINKDLLEKVVLETFNEYFSKDNDIKEIAKKLYELQFSNNENTNTINLLEQSKRHIENSISNIVKAIEKGIVSNATAQRLKELEKEQEEVEKQLILAKNEAKIVISENEILDYFEKAIKCEKAMLISYMVKEVIVFDDKIIIKLNSPINNESPDISQGFLLYDKTISYSYKIQQRRDLKRYNSKISIYI